MNLYDMLKIIFTKEGELPDNWQPFIINRFLSFHDSTFGLACTVDRYIFKLNDIQGKKTLERVYMNVIPKTGRQPWFKYIKKSKEGKKDLEFILESLQRLYKWTDRELEINSPLISRLLKDKNKLGEVMRFIGADLKYFKKYDINIEEGGLLKWVK